MVEGHSCQRLAILHRKRLLGKKFKACSPNQRFEFGASKIDGKVLQRIESHGKNLFYFFEGSFVMHVHFGMSGHFRLHSCEKAPEPRSTTRLKLVNADANIVALLSAMTVSLHDDAWYLEKSQELGPDPTREDADKERLWAKWQKTARPVGLVLMDQSMVAGIGNIFRAEILFKAGVHPEQPTKTILRDDFERIWMHSVGCLQAGVKHGSIRTVDAEEAKHLGKAWQRRYIYNQSTCGRCGSVILSWLMASRRAYCCPVCQPMSPNAEIKAERQKVLDAAARSQFFSSTCVRDPPVTNGSSLTKLKIEELRASLQARNLDSRGRKADLLARIDKHDAGLVSREEGSETKHKDETTTTLPSTPKRSTFPRNMQPSLMHVDIDGEDTFDSPIQRKALEGPNDDISTPLEAALEKFAAGENRSVEHIAEMDDDVASALENKFKKTRKRRAIQVDKGRIEDMATCQATQMNEAAVSPLENRFETPPKLKRLRKLSDQLLFMSLRSGLADEIPISQ